MSNEREARQAQKNPAGTYFGRLRSEQVLNENYLQWIIVFSCQMIFIGFVCSRALVSIGMISMIAGSLFLKGPLTVLKKYFQSPQLWALSLFFWIVFLSGLYSEDKSAWLVWVRIKLPFLFLPLAFAVVKRLDERKFVLILYGFVLILLISTIAVLANYYLHFAALTDSFNRGNQIPMPFSHIRYALMVVFASFCCIYLVGNKYFLYHKNERSIQIVSAVFFAVALHILSVRSGIIAFYPGLLFWALRGIFKERRIALGIVLVAAIIVAPMAAYKWLPSFHNKMEYMRYDLNEFEHNNINENSDAMRLLSMQIGLDIWKQHPIIGVGAGDINKEMNTVYAAKFPQISEGNRRMPHNQFIWVLMSTGIIGLAVFLFAFFYPLLCSRNYRNWLIVVLYITIFSSFFTEVTFEEQIGGGFYLIMLLILTNQMKPA